MNSDRTVDGDDVLVPVKLTKYFEKSSEELHLSLNESLSILVLAIVVEDEQNESIHTVSGHACELAPQ